MSVDRNIFCLFSDDIRHELHGKVSVMGIYQGGLNVVGNLPVPMPQLAVSVYINTPASQPLHEVSIDLMLNETVLQTVAPPAQALHDMQSSGPQHSDSHHISMLIVMQLQPFIITQEGRLFVRATLDGATLEGNALHIRVVGAMSAPVGWATN